MTHSPDPGNNEPNSEPSQTPRQHRRTRILLWIGAFLLAGIGGGLAYGWYFISNQLSPLVERSLTPLFGRPVLLGDVERFSLTGLRFGETRLPPTETDPDWVSIEAVEVEFDPLVLLTRRTLEVAVTLIEPEIYVEQNEQGVWLTTQLQPQPPGPIEIDLEKISVEDAEVVLVPRSPQGTLLSAVELIFPSAVSEFSENYQRIEFAAEGALTDAPGEFQAQGIVRLDPLIADVSVTTDDLAAAPLGRLVSFTVPVDLQSGQVDAELAINYSARREYPLLRGTATVQNLQAKLPQLPVPFSQTTGQLLFEGTEIVVDGITTRLGEIQAQAEGVVDLQTGVNLAAEIKPATLEQVVQALPVEVPPGLSFSGAVDADLQITGTLTSPNIFIDATNTQPIQLDKITLAAVRSELVLANSTLAIQDLQAAPVVGGRIAAEGLVSLEDMPDVALDVQLNNLPGEILRPYSPQLPIEDLGTLNAQLEITGSPNDLQALNATGAASLQIADGRITLPQIRLNEGRLQTQIDLSGIQAAQLAPQLPFNPEDPISGNFQLTANLGEVEDLTDFSALSATGSGLLNVAGGTLVARDLALQGGNLQADLRADSIQLSPFLRQLPPQVEDSLSGNLQINANLADFRPQTVATTGNVQINLAGGTVTSDLQLRQGDLQLSGQATGVQLGRLLPQLSPQVDESAAGNFQFTGELTQFDLANLQGTGSARLNLAGGTIVTRGLQIQQGMLQTTVAAQGVRVGRLAPQLPPLQGSILDGTLDVAANLDNLTPEGIRAQGAAQLAQVAGGQVTISNLRVAQGDFQATVTPQNVQLAGFAPQLEGEVSGQLNVGGDLANLTPAGIAAQGQLNFSQGLALIEGPLTTEIAWTGDRLQIEQATAPRFNARGFVDVDLAQQGLEQIERFNFDVSARGLNLAQLRQLLPQTPLTSDLNIRGLADLAGTITGTLTAPSVDANLALRDLAFNGFGFDPVLTGSIDFNPQAGATIALVGQTAPPATADRIELSLVPAEAGRPLPYEPVAAFIRQDEVVVQGTRQGDIFQLALNNVPVGLVKDLAPLPPPLATRPVSGDLSGELSVNLATLAAFGELAVANPSLGRFQGDRLLVDFRFDDRTLALQEGILRTGESQYLLEGLIDLSGEQPQFQAQLAVDQGRIEDLLAALQISEVADFQQDFLLAPTYGTAADLANLSEITLEGTEIETRLRRLAEVEAFLAQQQLAREQASPLPPLTEASGTFSGTAAIAGTPDDLAARFDFSGEDWRWGPYFVNRAIAEGTYEDGRLTLVPVRLQSGDTFLSLTGTIGGERQSAQLQVSQLPVALIRDFVELPPTLGFSGFINAEATFAGSQSNPSAIGEFALVDATLNQTPVSSVDGSFVYNDAVLNFFAQGLLTEEADPLAVAGTLPYRLPFATVEPATNQLDINVVLEDEGFAFLNAFTQGQVNLVRGEGRAELEISGPFDQDNIQLDQLTANGIAIIDDATLQAQAIADPITDVQGRILFNLNQIDVEHLSGNLGGGEIQVAGTLPLFDPLAGAEGLLVSIDQLDLTLKGLYRGDVQGTLFVGGALVEPSLGGDVRLSDGRVSLAAPANGVGAGEEPEEFLRFDDLEITLGNDVEIVRQPFLDFAASGSLILNGPLSDIRPEGTITLDRGVVNLFATQFRLARGYEQTAIFTPDRGLDPILDVRLVASVVEPTGTLRLSDPVSAEIADIQPASFGGLETVRVIASVEGPASRLAPGQVDTDVIELTSNPPRSEAEIVSLLGESFVNTLVGDGPLGLANIAGSAFFGSFNATIADALGLSEFRIFPVFVTGESEGESSIFALALEAGVEVTDRLSGTTLVVLTQEEPIRLGVRYRLNEQVLLRALTDFGGDVRVSADYEIRF